MVCGQSEFCLLLHRVVYAVRALEVARAWLRVFWSLKKSPNPNLPTMATALRLSVSLHSGSTVHPCRGVRSRPTAA